MEILLRILDPILGMLILFIIFGIGSWFFNTAKSIAGQTQQEGIRWIIPIFVGVLILYGLSTWWGILNLGFVLILASLMFMMPKGNGRWSGGYSEQVNQIGAYAFLLGLLMLIGSRFTN